jgi:hypothetical protein
MAGLQPLGDASAGAFSHGNRVHDFAAAVDTVTAGKIFRVGGLAGLGIDDYAAAAQFDASAAG